MAVTADWAATSAWNGIQNLPAPVRSLASQSILFSGIVTLAKLTPTGTNGSMTFVQGVLTQIINPT